MKNKKGFTLIELLAVIVIIAVIALITVPLILNVIETSKKGAARASVYAYIDAVEKYQIMCVLEQKECLKEGNYAISDIELGFIKKELIDYVIPKVYALDEITYVEGIYLNDIIKIKGEKPKTGYLELNNNRVISGEFIQNDYSAVYDGKIVEIGSKVKPGEDTTKPKANLIYDKKTSNSVSFVASCSDSGSGISKYQFYLDGDLKETYNTNEQARAFTYNSVASAEHEFKLVCTNGVSLTSEAIITTNPSEIIVPTYSVDKDGFASSKIVTITYPTREDNYIYSYSLDLGTTWITVPTELTVPITFISNGTVIARIFDGTNYKTASSYTISEIDTTPASATIGVTSKTTNKISVESIASDEESGITKYEFALDAGSYVNNETTNTYTYTSVTSGEHTLKVRVTNGAGAKTVTSVTTTTNEITTPTYSVSPTGYAASKTVTITYPTRETDFIYTYSTNEGSTWKTVSSGTTASVNFEENGSIIARIYDGTNYKTASSYTIAGIDKIAPTLSPSSSVSTVGKYTDNPVSNLFNIVWSTSGTGVLNCTDEGSNTINNTNTLEIGEHSVTCTAVGNNGLTSATVTKNFTVTRAIEENYYLLYDDSDLAFFRDLVNSGSNSSNAKLMNNINLSLIGSLYSKPMIISGMTKNGNLYVTNTTDPQIVFNNPNVGRTCGGTVVFASGISTSMDFQLFYVNATKPLSETNSVKKTLASGTTQFNINFPCGEYTTLRLDFGIKSGISFTISDIRYFNNWIPIGDQYSTGKTFNGIFEGNNKSVTNIYTYDEAGNYKGLFGTNTGTIKNLSLTGIIGSLNYTGAIAGKNSGTITNCTNNVSVWGTTNTGGITGHNTGVINYSTNNGQITGAYNNTGGISGYNNGQLSYNENIGVINGYGGQASGGITGVNGEGSTLTKSYNKGSVSGKYDVGGLAGFNYKATIYDSYNRGSVTATGTSDGTTSLSGGIAGDNNNATIQRVYNTGNVTASVTRSGGITGANYSIGAVNYSYNVGIVKAASYTASSLAGSTSNSYSGTIVGHNSSGTYLNVATSISLSNLGSQFKADTNNINGGYPILTWQ